MNYYTVCPDCGYKLLKAGDGSKHATKATGKEQVPPVAFCVKPHASPCASLRRIGHRNSDASIDEISLQIDYLYAMIVSRR